MESTKTLEALKSANSLCRSMSAIADREGEQTNWESFRNKLTESLALQHTVLDEANDFLDEVDIDED